VQQQLEKVAGIRWVLVKEQFATGAIFEVESASGQLVRGDLARAIVSGGWELNELRPSAMSLEEIFLQLTGTPAATAESAAAPPEPAPPTAPEAQA
jgi:ABC-2 type transport system ATP-binding protein